MTASKPDALQLPLRNPTQFAVLLLIAVALTGAAIAFANLATDVATRRFFDNVHWTLAYSVAAVLAWQGVRNQPTDNALPRKWLAAALTAYSVGQVLWDIQVAVGWNPFPGPSDLLFVCLGLFSGVGLGIGLFVLLGRATSDGPMRAAVLDIAGLSVAVLALVLALYLPKRGNTEWLPLMFLIAYPVVLSWAACVGIVSTLSSRLTPNMGWLLFMIGLCINTGLWLEWNARTLDGALVDGGPYNALFSVAAIAQGAGVYLWRMEVSNSPRVEAFCSGVLRLLPLIIVVLAALAVIFTHTLPRAPALMRDISLMGGLIVVVLASIRQSVLLTDRERVVQIERSLRLKQEAYRVLVEEAADGIFIADQDGRYLEVNQRGADMLGMTREEVLRLGIRDITAPHMLIQLPTQFRALLAGQTIHNTWQLKRKDGSLFDAEIAGKILSDGKLQGMVRDVSERKLLEEQLRQAQKMEAIGTLAAGIAHDFNNLLMAMRGYTDLVADALEPKHKAQPWLGEVRKASARAAQLVKQILAFARPSKPVTKTLLMLEVIEEVVRLLRSTLPAGVEIVITAQGDGLLVSADPAQLHQLLLNLGTNAWQAMEGRGGRIEFVLSREQVELNSQLSVSPGCYVCLRVIDTGIGMDGATSQRVFEPFFTTKRHHGGTGLGLTVVHGIVRNHGGAIVVDSALGKGTTFTIFLPQAQEQDTHRDEAEIAALAKGRGRRVLYVDDEQSLVSLMVEQLEQRQFQVLGATSADVALTAIRATPDGYDVVVSDYNMPKMSGLELLREVRLLRPGQPCLLISGYVDSGLHAAASAIGIASIIQKPHSTDELCAAIDRAMQ